MRLFFFQLGFGSCDVGCRGENKNPRWRIASRLTLSIGFLNYVVSVRMETAEPVDTLEPVETLTEISPTMVLTNTLCLQNLFNQRIPPCGGFRFRCLDQCLIYIIKFVDDTHFGETGEIQASRQTLTHSS